MAESKELQVKEKQEVSTSDAIDQDKIHAKLEDGVLRLTLPKVQKAVARQVMVAAG